MKFKRLITFKAGFSALYTKSDFTFRDFLKNCLRSVYANNAIKIEMENFRFQRNGRCG